MVYKLIIFDLDDTIIKSNSIARKVIRRFDKFGWTECVATSLLSLIRPVLRRRALHAIETFSGEYEPIVEVVNFIKYTPGYKMAIFSSNTRRFIGGCLMELKILERFSVIVSGEDIRILKPDPEGLKMILEISGVFPYEAIYFGSDPIDRLTGENAHIATVSSPNELTTILYKDRLFFYPL